MTDEELGQLIDGLTMEDDDLADTQPLPVIRHSRAHTSEEWPPPPRVPAAGTLPPPPRFAAIYTAQRRPSTLN